MSALVPHIAGEEEATRGYAMVGTARSVGNIAGLTGGALLAGIFGHPAALLIDGATFLVYALLLVLVRAERRPSGGHETRPSALAGIKHVGVLLGNRVAARLKTDSQVATALAIAGITTGIAVLIPAGFPYVVAAGIGWLIGGISNSVDNVAMNAIVRLRTPDEMRGRVFAAVGSMVTGANLLGTATAGALLLFIGPRTVFALGGTGALLAGVACLVFVRRALKNKKSPAEAGLFLTN